MKILEFPIICRALDENAILGQLLGYEKQLVASEVRGLTGEFSEYIEKGLRDGNRHYEPPIQNARLRTVKIRVRPTYREKQRIYPVKETIELPIHAIYGDNIDGYFECFLPLLRADFYFYQEKDLDKLIEHFAKEALHAMTPSEIYSLLHVSMPWLEKVSVKVPKPIEAKPKGRDFSSYTTLTGVAEQLPFTRKEAGKAILDVAWERGMIVDALVPVLTEEKAHVLLVGKSGVGKSTILHEVIRRIHRQEKSKDNFERHSFWRSSPSRITAKAKYLGEWQEICETLVEELSMAKGILWVENFTMLAMTGGEGAEDSVAAFLTSYIRQGQLQLIGELTQEQLEVLRKLLPGFVEHFRLIRIEEMDMAATLRIFEYFNTHVTKNKATSFTQKALEMSYILLERFVRYDHFPGKAIRFLQACADKATLEKVEVIDATEVIQYFSNQTGIPDFLLRDDQLLDTKALKVFFEKRIKGQPKVVDRIASVIKVFKAGLNDPHKPIATMIFAGPTGVGKTATAKAMADYFFGLGQKYQPLIRLDMSEFQHPAQIYRLIGTEGKLVQFVREKPFCVVLLDEIEKAHPQIFDALLTVLDEGILLDSVGRTTDFRNTIIIMTSNLGASQRSSLGFRSYQESDFEASIQGFFRPEFYNRIDMCLSFSPLDETSIREITHQELAEIPRRDGILNRNLKLEFTDSLVTFMAEKGFDPKYGARPLQREIERLIVAPLARLLIEQPTLINQTIQITYTQPDVVVRVV